MEGHSDDAAFRLLLEHMSTVINNRSSDIPTSSSPTFANRCKLFGNNLCFHCRLFPTTLCPRLLLCSLLSFAISLSICLLAYGLEDAIASGMLMIFTVLNCILSLRLRRLRSTELRRKVQNIISRYQHIITCNGDNVAKMIFACPSVCDQAPDSIQLQATYRSGRLIYLPTILLVKGDQIVVKAGQQFCCDCVDSSGNDRMFRSGTAYNPMSNINSSGEGAVEAIICTVHEAPIISLLTAVLRVDRPLTLFESECKRAVHEILEWILVPVWCLCSLMISLWWLYHRIIVYSSLTLLFRQWLIILLTATMPIIGLNFAPLLLLLNCWHFSWLYRLTSNSDHCECASSFKRQMALFWRTLLGDASNLFYGSNLLQSLGNATSICLVDKRGLLSLPDATPEKVFFFRDFVPGIDGRFGSSSDELRMRRNTSLPRFIGANLTDVTVEVLDLTTKTHDHTYQVNFDDSKWELFLANLKPICYGLRSLCTLSRQYGDYLNYIHNSALRYRLSDNYKGNRPILMNRRCFCLLSACTGFTVDDSRRSVAPELKSDKFIIGAYRPPDTADRMKLRSSTKLSQPAASIFCSVENGWHGVYQNCTGVGSAELVSDICTHIWSGSSIIEMTRSHRKRIKDFYMRFNLTSYCFALSYRPLCDRIISPSIAASPTTYITLPSQWPKSPYESSRVANIPSYQQISTSGSLIDVNSDSGMKEPSCAADILKDHVFIGLVTVQYQAKAEAIRMVDELGKACLRFVYFSKENELRSRLFAEKLGIEAGWNCHISLASIQDDDCEKQLTRDHRMSVADQSYNSMNRRNSIPPNMLFNIPLVHFNLSPLHQAKARSVPPIAKGDSTSSLLANSKVIVGNEASAPLIEAVSTGSLSSSVGGTTTPGVLPNKAQLPVGIEHVRPHINNIDNVPLLVNLFTDCDRANTLEMVKIMQEFGEIPFVIGSSLNAANVEAFATSNGSIAVRPEPPTRCFMKMGDTVDDSIRGNTNALVDLYSLASDIISLPCSLLVNGIDRLPLIDLIADSRLATTQIRAAMLFLLGASLSVSLVQLISIVSLLPPLFDSIQVQLLLFLLFPLQSTTISVSHIQPSVCLSAAMPKNTNLLSKKDLWRFALSFAIRFIPTCIASIACYWTLLLTQCYSIDGNNDGFSYPFDCANKALAVDAIGYRWLLVIDNCQRLAIHFYVISSVLISSSYVYYRHLAITIPPFSNYIWSLCAIIVSIVTSISAYTSIVNLQGIWQYYCGALIVWLLVAFVIIELYKSYEIRLYNRYQRRRKLNFNTKLGMNSPI